MGMAAMWSTKACHFDEFQGPLLYHGQQDWWWNKFHRCQHLSNQFSITDTPAIMYGYMQMAMSILMEKYMFNQIINIEFTSKLKNVQQFL
jgi:hypothetical protein